VIDAGTLAAWLEIACLAPSPHNNQPWTARLRPDGVLVGLDPRLLPPLGPDRVQFMALGAFIENMSYPAAAAGYELTVGELPTVPSRATEITVRVRAGAEPGGGAAIMLDGARRRRTNRGPYQPILPPGVIEELRAMPGEPATSVTLLPGPADRSVAADLAARAMRVFFSVPELRRDLAPFVFTGADTPQSTGMPIESLNHAAPAGVTGRQWALELADAEEEAQAARARYDRAPLHFVVSSRTDTLPGWIAGGRTLQRVLVTATVLGLGHCLAAGPSEIPTLLPALRRLAGPDTGRPLILGRLGVPADPAQSIAAPRRPVADILTS
jgi:hypothetical protein